SGVEPQPVGTHDLEITHAIGEDQDDTERCGSQVNAIGTKVDLNASAGECGIQFDRGDLEPGSFALSGNQARKRQERRDSFQDRLQCAGGTFTPGGKRARSTMMAIQLNAVPSEGHQPGSIRPRCRASSTSCVRAAAAIAMTISNVTACSRRSSAGAKPLQSRRHSSAAALGMPRRSNGCASPGDMRAEPARNEYASAHAVSRKTNESVLRRIWL